MNEDRLWAPWRLSYVSGDNEAGKQPPLPEPISWQPNAQPDCFLCRGAASYDESAGADHRLLVAYRGPLDFVVLNRYPYNNGHVLVAPRRHIGQLHELTRDEQLACQEQLARLTQVYRKILNAEGFNIGLNLGHVAGAGVPGHLHWHLVPRWSGDNNFMPALAGTRVIPQSLDSLWELLTAAIRNAPDP